MLRAEKIQPERTSVLGQGGDTHLGVKVKHQRSISDSAALFTVFPLACITSPLLQEGEWVEGEEGPPVWSIWDFCTGSLWGWLDSAKEQISTWWARSPKWESRAVLTLALLGHRVVQAGHSAKTQWKFQANDGGERKPFDSLTWFYGIMALKSQRSGQEFKATLFSMIGYYKILNMIPCTLQ